MRKLDAGTAGKRPDGAGPGWAALDLPAPWPAVVALCAGSAPRPVQALALGERCLLDHRRNLLVSAPTNGGKSLVGLVALLDAVQSGRRGVLLEPLRALAREKYEELRSLAPRLSEILGCAITPRITTGDYRLDLETYAAPPPDRGEIVVATPERFDAILRHPANRTWLESIGCVCVDEAHLLGAAKRGLTLEYVLTALKCLPAPPRLVLLSASVGDPGRVVEWLAPCDSIRVTERVPPLRKEVWELPADAAEGAADRAAVEFARAALEDTAAGVLVFVYQTRSAELLAQTLREQLGTLAGPEGSLAFHARLSAERRESVRAAFANGRGRVLVSTTALGLGVNLPATHVFVRDTTFAGVGRLEVPDLLQMMGRAGRGECEGMAVALVRADSGWNAEELARGLREERLPAIASALDRPSRRGSDEDSEGEAGAEQVLAHLVRHGEGLTAVELSTFFASSLGGRVFVNRVPLLLAWLADPARCLAYHDETGRYRSTVLGTRAARFALPLTIAAGLAQLVRDLLVCDPSDQFLQGWQKLDHLIVLELLRPRTLPGRRFGERLVEQTDAWAEAHPEWGSILYREWIRGAAGASRAVEVLGSLGVAVAGANPEVAGRELGYSAVFRAAVLVELGEGREAVEVERQWGLSGLDGIEERWRDEVLWLLAGVAAILDVRTFYFHLREVCSADAARVSRVKGALRRMRTQAFDLIEQLQHCSPLGSVLRALRRTARTASGRRIGARSIRRLEEAGVRTVADLARLSVADCVAAGVGRGFAEQLRAYAQRNGAGAQPAPTENS